MIIWQLVATIRHPDKLQFVFLHYTKLLQIINEESMKKAAAESSGFFG